MPRHLREDFLVGSSQVDPSSAMPLLSTSCSASPTPPTRSRARICIYMRNFVIGRLVYGGNRKVAKEELISLSGRGREERFFWCVENGKFGMLIEIFFLFSDDRVLNYSRLFDKLWLICLHSKGKLNMICSVVNFNCTFFNRLDQIMYFNENCNFNFSHEWK